eukprot:9221709-Pyramimonas_sp.AAC.1
MTLNTNGLVEVQDSCYLKQQSGAPASGISTTPADDLPFGSSCQTEMLPFDHNGFDTEDIHQIPGTPLCKAGCAPVLLQRKQKTGITKVAGHHRCRGKKLV